MARVVTRAILLNKDGKVLLGKRVRGNAAGQWALIGGKPNRNELEENAIVREVQEELGLFFKPTFWLEEKDTISVPGEEWKVVYYFGPVEGGLKLKSDEISEITFVEEKNLDDLEIGFDHKQILKNFFQLAI